MRRSVLVTLSTVIALAVLVSGTASRAQSPRSELPIHHLEQGFRNLNPNTRHAARGPNARARTSKVARDGAPLDVVPNDGAALRANGVLPTIT